MAELLIKVITMVDDKDNIIKIVVVDKSDAKQTNQHHRKEIPNYFQKLFLESLRENLVEELGFRNYLKQIHDG